LLHHQKPPAPNKATRITPTIATLSSQRIASFAIKIKMNSKTTPAIMKIVVKVMMNQWSVASDQWPVVNSQGSVVSKSLRLILAAENRPLKTGH
jgi:hypothetical protein